MQVTAKLVGMNDPSSAGNGSSSSAHSHDHKQLHFATHPSDITDGSEAISTIGYDHIMMMDDRQLDLDTRRKESSAVKFVFLTSCGFVALLGGFALNLALSGRRYRTSLKNKPTPEQVVHKYGKDVVLEDPVLFATRALGWGTLYAVLGTGTIGLTALSVWKL